MYDAIIIGGGVAGLTCAFRLRRSGARVLLLERSNRVGGSVLTDATSGYLLEMGPNTIQRSTPELETIVRSLGLEDEIVEASPEAGRRYIVRDGRPVVVPSSPSQMLSTDLLSARARLSILAEAFRRGRRLDDESVADFVRRRLGQEFLDYTIDPLVSGIYAGDPERLSMRHAFPRMQRLEDESGSLIRGSLRALRRRARTEKPRWKMFSFREGLSQLIQSLDQSLGDSIGCNVRITRIEQSDAVWAVHYGAESVHARSLVLALPLHALAELPISPQPRITAAEEVAYPPLAVVHTAYDRSAVYHPLDGFGMLVPSREPVGILGCLFSSSLFPDRAPPGQALLTTFIGGRRTPDIVSEPDNVLYRTVERDLGTLLDVRAEPVFRHVHRWRHAIPQYEVGYERLREQLAAAEEQHRGLFFAGNFRDGVSITDTVGNALDTAMKVTAMRDA